MDSYYEPSKEATMLFYVIARGCEDFAVALITAETLQGAVDLLVPRFQQEPDKVQVKENSAQISFDDFIDSNVIKQVMNLGDVRGDIAMNYIVKPVPPGPYVKIGCYVD